MDGTYHASRFFASVYFYQHHVSHLQDGLARLLQAVSKPVSPEALLMLPSNFSRQDLTSRGWPSSCCSIRSHGSYGLGGNLRKAIGVGSDKVTSFLRSEQSMVIKNFWLSCCCLKSFPSSSTGTMKNLHSEASADVFADTHRVDSRWHQGRRSGSQLSEAEACTMITQFTSIYQLATSMPHPFMTCS